MKKEKKIESKTKRSLPGYGTATYPDTSKPKMITIEAPEGALVVPKDMILQWALKVITEHVQKSIPKPIFQWKELNPKALSRVKTPQFYREGTASKTSANKKQTMEDIIVYGETPIFQIDLKDIKKNNKLPKDKKDIVCGQIYWDNNKKQLVTFSKEQPKSMTLEDKITPMRTNTTCKPTKSCGIMLPPIWDNPSKANSKLNKESKKIFDSIYKKDKRSKNKQ